MQLQRLVLVRSLSIKLSEYTGVRRLLCLVFLYFSNLSFGQVYLNDTTLFDSQYSQFQSVYEVDTGFFVLGMNNIDEHNNTMQYLLGFIDYDNSKQIILSDFDSLNNQFSGFYTNNLFRNDLGNFVSAYRNCDTVNCYPRFKEVSLNGNIITDLKLNGIVDSMNGYTYDFGEVIQKKNDSTYIITASVSDLSVTSGHKNGILVIQLSKDKVIMDTSYFFDPLHDFDYIPMGVVQFGDGSIVIMASKNHQAGIDANEVSSVLFFKLDQNNNFMNEMEYTDGQRVAFPMGFSKSDSGYCFTYLKGNLIGNNWKYKYYLTRVDKNFDHVWSKQIYSGTISTITQYQLQQEIKRTLDNNYVLVGAAWDSIYQRSTALITKFTDSGDFLWQRRLILSGSDNTEAYEIKDVISTADSGYCMVGQITFFNPTVQKGYIVKTNCLGFLGEPEAAANYLIEDDFKVEFYNTSTQAGSYTWIFGDGESITTDEYTDTISHTFPGFGLYEVMLIAHGCNGIADTLIFEVNPTKHTDPTVVTNGNGYFSIFPNPVSSGSQLYIYLNGLDSENGEVYLNLYTMTGQLAEKIKLTASEGTYLINQTLASGIYMAVLFQGNEMLQERKLLVK